MIKVDILDKIVRLLVFMGLPEGDSLLMCSPANMFFQLHEYRNSDTEACQSVGLNRRRMQIKISLCESIHPLTAHCPAARFCRAPAAASRVLWF